jgi:defect-in-organelle-trafficking protein DotB
MSIENILEDQEKQVFANKYDGEIFNFDGLLNVDHFDDLLLWATKKKASDITIESNQPVFAEIGGDFTRVTRKTISHPEIEMITQAIYDSSGPAEILMGNDIDTAYEIKDKNSITNQTRFRVNITACRTIGRTGFQITIRTLPSQPIEIEKLGIEEDIISNIRPKDGLNLITGPTGSGKSTLLSSLLRHLCERPDANEKVLEYSRPIEYVYDGLVFPSSLITQLEVGKHLRPRSDGNKRLSEDSEWAYCTRNALRRKPTMLIIGEARDASTIEGCIQLSLTGHLVMSTTHNIGVPETIMGLISRFPGDVKKGVSISLLEVLNLCVTQILEPKIGGGKVALREYLLFDRNVRKFLLDIDYELWSRKLREILQTKQVNGKPVVGKSMSESAYDALLVKKITEDQYEKLSARTKID